MSRTKRREGRTSPVELYIRWKGSEGGFEVYDKSTREKSIVKKLSWAIIDQRLKLGKFVDEGDNYRSTEIHPYDVKKEDITLYQGSKKVTSGAYREIKEEFDLKTSIILYVVVKGKDGFRTGKIEIKSSNLGEWMNFMNGKEAYEKLGPVDSDDIYDYIFSVKKSAPKKKGSNKWKDPVFSREDIEDDYNEAAEEADEELQKFFSGASESPNSSEASPQEDEEDERVEVEDDVEYADDEDDLPF